MPSGLISIESMPHVIGLVTPESFYLVTHEPAPLAGMSRPSGATSWSSLYDLGLHRVICLMEESPDYKPDPLILAGHFPLQDLYGGLIPTNPDHETLKVCQACKCALSLLQAGFGVVLHCIGGTGRTGTVIGCTLKGLGYNTEDVIDYLDYINRFRGKQIGWPESPWQAEQIRQFTGV